MTNKPVITDVDFDRLNALLHSRQGRITYGPLATMLQSELGRGEIVPADQVPDTVITMHCTVRFRDLKTSTPETFTLVFPHEADLDDHRLSVLSPLGTALLGAKVGDTVTVESPTGPRELKIEEITQPDPSP